MLKFHLITMAYFNANGIRVIPCNRWGFCMLNEYFYKEEKKGGFSPFPSPPLNPPLPYPPFPPKREESKKSLIFTPQLTSVNFVINIKDQKVEKI